MAERDVNGLYQQMGEVLEGLRSLSAITEIRHSQAEKLHDLVAGDLVALRRAHGDLDEKLECVICVVQNDLESLRSQSASSARSVDALTAAVQDLKKPVSEIVALRARVGGLLVGLGILGSALAWLAEPIYRWSVEQHYLKH